MAAQTTKSTRRGESTYHTRAVSRACQLLLAFSVDDFELSIADLHKKLGIHKSTLVRLLQCMAEEGFIEQNPETDKYRLGIKTFEVGSRYLRARMGNIGAVARPLMRELVDIYHVSANLAFRDGVEIVYVEAVEPNGVPLRVAYSVGDRFGIHHTALGKALVAWLPLKEQQKLLQQVQLKKLTPTTIATPDELEEELRRVRERGYAVDDEESMPGLRCVGAPIWGANGVAAALSASGTTLQILPESVEKVAHSVMEAAAVISAQLGGTPRLEG